MCTYTQCTSFSTQVLSGSVLKALTHTLGAAAEQTAAFTAIFDKFFDCLNVASLSAGKLQGNAFKALYRSVTDFRLKVCHRLPVEGLSQGISCYSITLMVPLHIVVAQERFHWLFGSVGGERRAAR